MLARPIPASETASEQFVREICPGLHFPSCGPPLLFINPRSSRRCGRSSGVEHNLAKVRVVSSNLIARSSLDSVNKHLDKAAFGRPFCWCHLLPFLFCIDGQLIEVEHCFTGRLGGDVKVVLHRYTRVW